MATSLQPKPKRKPAKTVTGHAEIAKFVAALPEPTVTGHSLIGMVRAAPKADGLLVAHFGDCRYWAHIPIGAIDSVKQNGQVRCGTHTHTVAAIQLKPPGSDLELGYSAIADLHLAKLNAYSASIGGAGYNCPPGQHWGPDSSGNWGCQVGP